MKKYFFFLIATSFLLVACPPLPQHIYDTVEYKAIARGSSESIFIEQKNKKEGRLTYAKNNLQTVNRILNKEEFHSLFDHLRYLNVDNFSQLKVPSKKHQYDGALITRIIITSKGKTFKSPAFDHDNPPKELKPLVNYLKGLIQ